MQSDWHEETLSWRRHLRAAACLGLCLSTGQGMAQTMGEADAHGDFQFEGYNKTLAVNARTADSARQAYDLVLNRTRLKLTYTPNSSLQFRLEDDVQVRVGNYLSTNQAVSEAKGPSRRLWKLDSRLASGRQSELTNDVYRGYVKWSHGESDVWFGRQRVALGTGRLWSTVDLLNPLNPLQIERDEYIGVDAVRVDHRLSPLSKITGVYAPDPDGNQARWTARVGDLIGESEVNASVTQAWGDTLGSIDVATQIGGFGLRGELTAVNPRLGKNHVSSLLGVDYAFANTLTFSVETYLSTQDQAERQAQFSATPLRQAIEPMGTRYVGMVASYEFTPLIKGTLIALANLSDDSRFYSAAVSYSLSDDLVVQVGLHRFSGRIDSEYGRGAPLAYAQAQWFF